MIKLFKYLFVICVIYTYVYNPVLSNGLDPMIILYPFLIYLILKKDKKDITYLRETIISWLFVFTFIIFRTLLGSDSGYLYNWIGSLIETVLLSYAISLFVVRNKLNMTYVLIYTGIIAAVISVICLFLPTVNEMIRGIQIVYSDAYERNLFRGFGFAQGLNFEYSFIQAFVFSLILYNFKDRKILLLAIPLLILSILVNARSGILAVFIAIGVYFISSKRILNSIVTILIAVFVLASFYNIFYQYIPESTAFFIDEFFLEIKDALLGTSEAQFNTAEELTKNMIILPETVEGWFCGYGKSLFGSGSDVGYVIQLYYGGIIYLILLYKFDYTLIKKCFPFVPKGLFSILILSLLLANLKGGILGGNNGAIRFVALFASYSFIANNYLQHMNFEK